MERVSDFPWNTLVSGLDPKEHVLDETRTQYEAVLHLVALVIGNRAREDATSKGAAHILNRGNAITHRREIQRPLDCESACRADEAGHVPALKEPVQETPLPAGLRRFRCKGMLEWKPRG